MRRTLCLVLLQLLAGGQASAQVVGLLNPSGSRATIRAVPRLVESQVLLRMQMNTDARGLADIALKRARKGKLVLGPRTKVLFDEQVVAGHPPIMTLRQQVGQLRLVLIPQAKEPGEGEYRIVTEAGTVRVLGTDVYVRTGSWGMVVAVAEGEVEVEGRTGVPVTVRANQWTYVPVGQPPMPPRSDDDGHKPPPDLPGDLWPFDPPGFDDLRFDLPR